MREIIKKSIQIINIEGFNGLRNRILLNLCIFILLIILQIQDIGSQMIANFFSVIWIAINSYYVCSMFLKGNRNFILFLSKLSNFKKVFLLLAVSSVINIFYFVYIIVQLYHLGANIFQIIYISILQYSFGVILGTVLGFFYKKNLGLGILILLGFINFFYYNIYNYSAYNHIFSISQMLYSVNSMNLTNILGFILVIIGGVTFSIVFMNLNYKKNRIRILALIILLFSIYFGRLYKENIDFERIQNKEYKVFNLDNHLIKYRGISAEQAEDFAKIGIYIEEEYNKIIGITYKKEYVINKMFLSDVLWFLRNRKVESEIVKDNNVKINVLSNSMMNFENSDLLKNFIQAMEAKFSDKIYNDIKDNKYKRHLLDGYSTVIKRNVSGKLKFRSKKRVVAYYENDLQKIFIYPSNKNNFIKRIAMLSYNRYPESAILLYQTISKEKVQTDDEFIRLLKSDFKRIYNDEDIRNIIRKVSEEKS